MSEVNFRAHQAANKRKTFLLLASFGALMWMVVYAALTYMGAGTAGIVPIAVGLSLISVWGSYYASDKLVLTMTGARAIQESDNPRLFALIQEVCLASGLPMPKVAIVEDRAPNAFATGRNPEHALIAFTTGILDAMDRDELQGVIAHEMAHVANRDTLVSAVAATTAGAIAIFSDFLMRMMWFGGGRRDDRPADRLRHRCDERRAVGGGDAGRRVLRRFALLPPLRVGGAPPDAVPARHPDASGTCRGVVPRRAAVRTLRPAGRSRNR